MDTFSPIMLRIPLLLFEFVCLHSEKSKLSRIFSVNLKKKRNKNEAYWCLVHRDGLLRKCAGKGDWRRRGLGQRGALEPTSLVVFGVVSTRLFFAGKWCINLEKLGAFSSFFLLLRAFILGCYNEGKSMKVDEERVKCRLLLSCRGNIAFAWLRLVKVLTNFLLFLIFAYFSFGPGNMLILYYNLEKYI